MKKVRIGWIGGGFVGQVAHLHNYVQMPDVEIVALSEQRENLGKNLCGKFNIPHFHKDHKELVARDDIDAVVAVVQRQHVGPVAFDVLNASKHLFTEKPMAQTREKAALLVDTAKKNNLVYAVGYMRRHDPGVQHAKKLIAEFEQTKKLGEILFVRLYLSAGGDYCNIDGMLKTDEPKTTTATWPTSPAWLPEDRAKEYDHFTNVCSHDLNLLRYLFGKRPKVTFVDYRRKRGSIVALDFGEHAGAFEWGDTLQPVRWEEGLEIIYEKGRLQLDLPPAFLRNQPAKLVVYEDGGRATGLRYEPTFDWKWSFQLEDEAFVKDVSAGTEPISSGANSLEDFDFIDDIWRKILAA
jgi:predicted dehydrogenase